VIATAGCAPCCFCNPAVFFGVSPAKLPIVVFCDEPSGRSRTGVSLANLLITTVIVTLLVGVLLPQLLGKSARPPAGPREKPASAPTRSQARPTATPSATAGVEASAPSSCRRTTVAPEKMPGCSGRRRSKRWSNGLCGNPPANCPQSRSSASAAPGFSGIDRCWDSGDRRPQMAKTFDLLRLA